MLTATSSRCASRSGIRSQATGHYVDTVSFGRKSHPQAAAGIYSAHTVVAIGTYARDDEDDLEDIVEQAIRTSDEHAIKFVEAYLDEHQRKPAPLFLAAAADAAARLMP